MSTNLRIVAISVVAVVLWAGTSGAGPSTARGSDLEPFPQANNAVALALYGSLGTREGNVFFSPYSLTSLLAMIYGGARGGTAAQIAKALHFSSDANRSLSSLADIGRGLRERSKQEQYELLLANGIWMNKGQEILPEYRELIKKHFNAEVREVDFVSHPDAATKAVNEWTERQTAGKIKDLIPAGVVGPSTRLVLTNAVYFKGSWSSGFSEDSTSQGSFVTATGTSVLVPMMAQTAKFKYLGEKTFQVLEMDYRGNGLSMVVILPKATNGLPELEQSLSVENVNDWLSRLIDKQVSVSFPMFTLSSSFMLVETLKALGMTDAFSVPPADFSGINGQKTLAVSQVVHQAFVNVTEQGTEAAAASAASMEETASYVDTEFVADHPFVFLIRDKQSGTILFLGRVTNPTPSSEIKP